VTTSPSWTRQGPAAAAFILILTASQGLAGPACTPQDPGPASPARPGTSAAVWHLHHLQAELAWVGQPHATELQEPLALRDAVRSLLLGSSPWTHNPGEATADVQMSLVAVDVPAHGSQVIVRTMWLASLRRGAERTQVELELSFEHERSAFAGDAERHLRDDLARSARLLTRAVALRDASDRELLAALPSLEPPLLASVLREAQRRRLHEAAPWIALQLMDMDDELALVAIGTLAQLGAAPEAAAAVARCENRSPAFLVAAAPALARLRTPVTQGYLIALAEGHSDAWVRQSVRQVLDGDPSPASPSAHP
jgi:hypothetical protein